MRLRPRAHSDTVIILADTSDPRSAGGIEVPSAYRWEPTTGTVVAVGAGIWGRRIRTEDARWGIAAGTERTFYPTGVTVGMRVAWDKYLGTKIEADGQVYILLPDSFIAAEITP